MIKDLITKAKEIETKEFETPEKAKKYARELAEIIEKEEQRIMQQKRELEDTLYELRHAEARVTEYRMNVK